MQIIKFYKTKHSFYLYKNFSKVKNEVPFLCEKEISGKGMTEIMTVWKKGIGEKMDGQAKTDENEASKSLEETKAEKVKKGKGKKMAEE